jgi:hypothetical protein
VMFGVFWTSQDLSIGTNVASWTRRFSPVFTSIVYMVWFVHCRSISYSRQQ